MSVVWEGSSNLFLGFDAIANEQMQQLLLHKLNTAWNNSFRRIFSCCWRESTRPLQFFCKSLPFLPRDAMLARY